MAEYLIQDTTLDAIADAINAKTGGSAAMTPAQMVTAIESISGGGGSQKTLTKLYEADVTEPVRSIAVPITSTIQNCKMFAFVHTGLTFNASDWFAIRINAGMFYCNPQATNPPDKIRLCGFLDSFTINGTTNPIKPLTSALSGDLSIMYTQVSDWSSISNGITSITIGAYTGNTDITAGHFEIWGWV